MSRFKVKLKLQRRRRKFVKTVEAVDSLQAARKVSNLIPAEMLKKYGPIVQYEMREKRRRFYK